MDGRKFRLDKISNRKNAMEEMRGEMPVSEACARVGADYSMWYKWERGNSFPTLPYVWRIEIMFSEFLNTPISYRDIWPGLDPSLNDLEG